MRGMAGLDDIAAGATKLLNTHGYAFEQVVIHCCANLYSGEKSDWRFVVSEYPVLLHGRPHHIDFVLEHKQSKSVLVAECKRVDPARSRWCFVRRTYTDAATGVGLEDPIVSLIKWTQVGGSQLVEFPTRVSEWRPYHLCLELKTDQKGDGVGSDLNGSMPKASDQAFRSASGFIERMKTDGGSQLPLNQPLFVLAAIFTTATLFTAETAIADADLKTGNIDKLEVSPAQWVWYQQNLSQHLRPSESHQLHDAEPRGAIHDSLERAVIRHHTRALCVVNVQHIHEFLRAMSKVDACDRR
jgi:hypothetical protein